MTKPWRPEGWQEIKSRILPLRFESLDPEPFRLIEAGADAMHKADVKWLIERIIHDDRGYMFRMSDKEWQGFINDRKDNCAH